MYPAAMADTDLFDSSHPAHTEREPDDVATEYENVFKALSTSVGVAEVVFARAVKMDLRDHLSYRHFPIQRVSEGETNHLPTWVTQTSVALVVTPTSVGAELRGYLEDLVSFLGIQMVTSCKPGNKLVLVEPAYTRVHPVNPDEYNFVVKQKWSVVRDA